MEKKVPVRRTGAYRHKKALPFLYTILSVPFLSATIMFMHHFVLEPIIRRQPTSLRFIKSQLLACSASGYFHLLVDLVYLENWEIDSNAGSDEAKCPDD